MISEVSKSKRRFGELLVKAGSFVDVGTELVDQLRRISLGWNTSVVLTLDRRGGHG